MTVQAGLYRTWSETQIVVFLIKRLEQEAYYIYISLCCLFIFSVFMLYLLSLCVVAASSLQTITWYCLHGYKRINDR